LLDLFPLCQEVLLAWESTLIIETFVWRADLTYLILAQVLKLSILLASELVTVEIGTTETLGALGMQSISAKLALDALTTLNV